jgi:TPR repeat protein/serine/threonine protein kinase
MSIAVLNTCDNIQYKGMMQAQYYLEYTGDELLRAAVHNLRMATNPALGVWWISQTSAARWLQPNLRIVDQGVRHGDTICIVPNPAAVSVPPPFAPGGSVSFGSPTAHRTQPILQPAAQPTVQTPKPNFRRASTSPSSSAATQAQGRRLDELKVRISDYPKIRDIGRGAFGVIYSAKDPRTGQMVAVKVMRLDMNPTERQMFEREVCVLAAVDHPTLLGLRGFAPFAATSPDDPPAIITDYMAGGSLQSVIDLEKKGMSPGKWDDTRRLIVVYGIAVAMMTLHAKRIIHRDLKPDNVLLDENLEPKVADFGLSKFVESGATRMQTMHGGTAPYMAPEIHQGEEYSFAVDVYAFGILVYVMTTTLDPFPNVQSSFALGQKVTRGERPQIPNYISSNYRELIQACWDGNPANRPKFEEIVAQLGNGSFMSDTVDDGDFTAYQEKVVPPELRMPTRIIRSTVVSSQKAPSKLDQLFQAADSGDAFAANQVGCRLRDGQGVSKNLDRAAQYFCRAAEGGNSQGMINWGLALEMAHGTRRDFAESCRWYKRAMDAGEVHAYYCYADMLENGKGVGKDEAEAARLFKIAADRGHARAQNKYGLSLEMGRLGLKKDLVEAVRYYKMASDQGSPQGMFFYADMLEDGKGVEKNIPEALKLYRLAASHGHSQSAGYYGFLLVKGEIVKRDVPHGLELIQAQASMGDYTAFMHLGRLYEEGWGVPKDLSKAFESYKKASDNGLANGRFQYARCLKDGIGCRADLPAAYQLFKDTAEKFNHSRAHLMVGLMLIKGEGVAEDSTEGVKWIRKAANLGDANAKQVIARLES